jgi:transcriptional regulator with XRE-family HTH domain
LATWAEIRDHYDRIFEARKHSQGLTQQQVADAGGLKGQNAISKLLANRNKLGPRVGTLVGAVLGLGIPLSEFFAAIERHEPHQARRGATATYRQLSDSDQHALAIGRYVLRIVGGMKPSNRPATREVGTNSKKFGGNFGGNF